jgi:hypothetical protein
MRHAPADGGQPVSREGMNIVELLGRRRVWFWIVVMILLAALMAVQVVMSRRADAAMAQWVAEQKAELAERETAYERVAAVFRDVNERKGPRLTRRDAEEAFNGGKPLTGDRVSVTEPISGKPVELVFAGDVCMGVMFLNVPTSPMPRWTAGMIAVTGLRRLLYIAGYIAWGVMFLIHLVSWRRQSRAAAIRRRVDLLMLATLSTVLITVRHGYAHAWTHFFDDESGAWGLIMVPVSILLLLLALRPAKPSRAHLCADCGYDLTGNVSGVCPECGSKVTEDLGATIARQTQMLQR